MNIIKLSSLESTERYLRDAMSKALDEFVSITIKESLHEHRSLKAVELEERYMRYRRKLEHLLILIKYNK